MKILLNRNKKNMGRFGPPSCARRVLARLRLLRTSIRLARRPASRDLDSASAQLHDQTHGDEFTPTASTSNGEASMGSCLLQGCKLSIIPQIS